MVSNDGLTINNNKNNNDWCAPVADQANSQMDQIKSDGSSQEVMHCMHALVHL
jgi:hypothetical protein